MAALARAHEKSSRNFTKAEGGEKIKYRVEEICSATQLEDPSVCR